MPVLMANVSTKGIFCLEGEWDNDLRKKRSIRPVLDLLQHSNSPRVDSIRRDVGTKAEFEYYLRKWSLQKYQNFRILYLAFHGEPGELCLGDEGRANLDWLEERLQNKCKNCLIHFGSCGTLDTHGKRLQRFMRSTGALAVCGYRSDVDWMLSTSFELILMSTLQHNAFTRSGLAAVQKRLKREAKGLVNELKFRLLISNR
jgi:hypothetical protein